MMGQDPLKILEYDALVELVTAESMQATAQKYFTLENVVEGVLYPE
jgi:predicted Zn-dependent peptidase